jgi:HupE/UreJ protein
MTRLSAFIPPALCIALAFAVFLLFSASVLAHPADEFCGPDSGLDPELCRALQEMDQAEPVAQPSEQYGNSQVEVSLDRPMMETVWLYMKLGFIHILPAGYDHILFVLALFLGATTLRQLIWQISAFTLAHTITLGLATMGTISAPASIVEPLIALSIAFVAIENLLFRNMPKWRPLVVFGFGLFHGLGFAGVLKDLGLVKEQLLTSLISFNVGVELGQITIISLAACAVFAIGFIRPALKTPDLHRRFIVIPFSLIIAGFGLFWFINRLIGLL